MLNSGIRVVGIVGMQNRREEYVKDRLELGCFGTQNQQIAILFSNPSSSLLVSFDFFGVQLGKVLELSKGYTFNQSIARTNESIARNEDRAIQQIRLIGLKVTDEGKTPNYK